MYEVVLGSGVRYVYNSKGPTGIWTNIAGWVPRRCSCTECAGHAAAIGSKGAKKPPNFPELGIAPKALRPQGCQALDA